LIEQRKPNSVRDHMALPLLLTLSPTERGHGCAGVLPKDWTGRETAHENWGRRFVLLDSSVKAVGWKGRNGSLCRLCLAVRSGLNPSALAGGTGAGPRAPPMELVCSLSG
jgi:hypothetical protein